MNRFFIFLILLIAYPTFAQDSLLVFESKFELDARQLSRSEKDRLDSLLAIAPVDIIKKVEIYGHTDSLAGLEYNKRLSKDRVISVLRYLVANGLDPLKVQTDYYGEERPKYENSPELRFKNRRVELHLHISLAMIPPPEQKLSDIKLKTGDKIQIPNLNFVGNQPIPVWQSFTELQELLALMLKNPEMEIELQGHVCCSNNLELSQQRARTVYDFLKFNGVSEDRLSYKGYSNSRPLNKEKNEEEKAQNRRVEILVLENTDAKASLEEDLKIKIDLRTQVLNIDFFPNAGRFKPSGDFMLGLIIDMLKESKGLKYEFVLYNNIDNKKVTDQRVNAIRRKISVAGIKRGMCTVEQAEKPERMPTSVNDNYIILKIKK